MDLQTPALAHLAARLSVQFPGVPPDTVLAIVIATCTPADPAAQLTAAADSRPAARPSAERVVARSATRGAERPAADAEARGQDMDLHESLAALATLAMGHGLGDLLRHVAQFAVHAIPGADAAGLTLFQDDHPDTVVATAAFVQMVDAIQYDLGEGPCITATTQRRTVRCGSLSEDPAYPLFGPQARNLGVHSALSLPLLGPTGALGSINVYAHARDAFTAHAATLGELFAVPASISVQNAHTLAQAQRLAATLQHALTAATGEVGAAITILMNQQPLDLHSPGALSIAQ